jgi:hypothetical protein
MTAKFYNHHGKIMCLNFRHLNSNMVYLPGNQKLCSLKEENDNWIHQTYNDIIHEKEINLVYNDKHVIITSGLDKKIKVWDFDT